MKPAQSKTKAETRAKTKAKTKRKSKKSRRIQNVPRVVIVAKLPEPKPAGKEFNLRELGQRSSRIVEFPQMKGRTVQAVRFYTSADENTVSIRFSDRTQLSLHFEPALVLTASLFKVMRWDSETIKEWPAIHSAPRNPEH
jgi:hypothetical protein